MSSKKAMKQAQKQSYAKHRSNITNSKIGRAHVRTPVTEKSRMPSSA